MILVLLTLSSLASLHYYQGPGGSGVGWWAGAAMWVTWAIVTGVCLRNYVKCPHKNHPEERVGNRGNDGDWGNWSECDSYYRATMRRQRSTRDKENICPSLFIILICAVCDKILRVVSPGIVRGTIVDIQLRPSHK